MIIIKKYTALFSALSTILVSIAGCTSTEKAFEKEMEEFRQRIGNVGMGVGVVKDGRLIYTHSFGLADVENGIPVKDNTLFRIASISKSFSATSVMQLVEKGKLSLSMDVSDLAGFPIRNPKFPDTVITLEMLMSHTSSINDSQGYFSFDGINPDLNPDWAKCYNDYEPGTGYEYCNLNYNLIGSFIEKISGERFDQYVVHHVLEPLGLYGGYCVDSLDTSLFAKLYSNDPDNGSVNGEMVESKEAYAPRSERIRAYRTGTDTPVFSPTGGMKISAPDLTKYMIMHMNYGIGENGVRLISEESSRSMQTPRSSDENYGLALWVDEGGYIPGVTLTGHTGGAYGLRSAMFFDPEKKYGFVMISNGASDSASEGDGAVIDGSLRIMYKHFINK
ncbi:MAG: beta-lactamase family protein [Bacteroidales bacterium]|nr:beta-lactamase family protein [Bacteroidales bacterium]